MSIFNFLFIKNKGKNNNIKIDNKINAFCNVKGANNNVLITSAGGKSRIRVKINGNNNTLTIKEAKNCKRLFIDIGNLVPCDNVTVEIGENFYCVDATILAYKDNVPIKIGSNCLFSKNVKIRSGELPHKIYDTQTNENLDNSTGIEIGNHVWIGEDTYIMKKVKISDNSIVGAGSVVTRKFNEENVVIAGNPASICRRNTSWK